MSEYRVVMNTLKVKCVLHKAVIPCLQNPNFIMVKFLFCLLLICMGKRNAITEAVLTSTHDLCFIARIRKNYTAVKPSFTI